MRVQDIIPRLLESNDYQTEKKNNILAALAKVKSLEELGKIISYGSFRITPEGSEHTNYYDDAQKIIAETPEIESALLDVVEKNLQTDEDIIFYFSSGLHYSVDFDKVLKSKRDMFTSFFMKEIQLVGGKIEFKSEKIKQFPLYKKIMMLLLKHDHDAIYSMFKEMMDQLPSPKVKFDYTNAGYRWRGSEAIAVDPKQFVSKFYHLCVIAFYLDDFAGNENTRTLVFKSPQYKAFARGLKNEVRKMLSITEADIYQEEFKMFLDSHSTSEFFRTLSQFIRMLDDVRDVGRDVFAWYYHLPRHGQVHGEKKKFLSVYSDVISRSNLMQFVKLESIFDDRSDLQDLVGYE